MIVRLRARVPVYLSAMLMLCAVALAVDAQPAAPAKPAKASGPAKAAKNGRGGKTAAPAAHPHAIRPAAVRTGVQL